MIYTIGYQTLVPEILEAIVTGLGAVLVDCRSVPKTRIKGFGQRQLTERFGSKYVWKGDVLGGRKPGVKMVGIDWLREQDKKKPPLVLMCLEDCPFHCHRHHAIALPYFRDSALHIWEGGIYTVSEWQKAFEASPQDGFVKELRRVTDDFVIPWNPT